MVRRMEFAAAVAAIVLDVLALAILLFAPLVSYCADHNGIHRTCENVAYTNIVHTGLEPGGWAFLIGMFLTLLIAAIGAILESRLGWRAGIAFLWAGGVLALAGCVIASTGIGVFYLPAILAVALATYASIFTRIRQRRAADSNMETTGTEPVVRR